MRLVGIALLLAAFLIPTSTTAATLDAPVPNGWWFSQTGVPGERGFALFDDQQARFWSEFQRLGGVPALGYPASQRFELDGFTVQATQRVIMQWRPDAGQVYFVNVFDVLHERGRDDWLRLTRQTPPPRTFASLEERLALLEPWPALARAYRDVVGDPIQANGYPVSDVVDMGNHYALRCQRVVLQQWKEDVAWARAGQVTVALGGDIAKETGLVPSAAALPRPVDLGGVVTFPEVVSNPVAGDPLTLLPAAGEVRATPLDEASGDATVMTRGRSDSGAHARRLFEAGYVRGARRVSSRLAPPGRPITEAAVFGSGVDLLRDPATTRAYWERDAQAGWASPDSAARLESVPAPLVGEELQAFRIVTGDVAGRGYLVLFRRLNAVGHVWAVSQTAYPDLEELIRVARDFDNRIVAAVR